MKRLRNRIWGLLPVLFFLPGIMYAQPPDTTRKATHSFNVQQAVDYALKNNVNVKNALVDVRIQEQVNREVTSNALPKLNGNLSTSYNPAIASQLIPDVFSIKTYEILELQGVKNGSGVPITSPGNFGLLPFQLGTKFTATAGISLSQILFDGQVFIGLMARDATMRFSRKNVEVTEEMIKANIYKIYYQLVVSKTQIELLDANIVLIEKLLKDTRIIYENGFAERLDVDKVNVQLTNLLTEKRRVLNTISNGYYGLKVLMGMPVSEELHLTESITDDKIKEGILETAVYSYSDRKEFQYAEIGKELNQYNIRRYKLSKVPTVMLTGNYAKNAQRDRWNFIKGSNWFTIAAFNLGINIPIFNGFYTKSKIEQANLQLQKTENNIEALKLSIDNEVAIAKNNFNSAIATMDFQKKNMELAEKIYQQTKKKYEMGIGSQTEINNAQTELKAAQTNYITALYDAIISRVDFMKATGKL